MFIFTIFSFQSNEIFLKKRVSKKFCFVRRVGQMGQVGRGENFELGTNCKLVPAGGNATPCCSNRERRSLRCCIFHKRTDKTDKSRAIFNLARLLLYHLIDYRRIFSLIDIVEPFLPIGFQITLQVVSVVRAIQNIVINYKNYIKNMKKVFRKIQKGTTKMIERIKSLGEMETKQKCVVQRFEIIIPLHQK